MAGSWCRGPPIHMPAPLTALSALVAPVPCPTTIQESCSVCDMNGSESQLSSRCFFSDVSREAGANKVAFCLHPSPVYKGSVARLGTCCLHEAYVARPTCRWWLAWPKADSCSQRQWPPQNCVCDGINGA